LTATASSSRFLYIGRLLLALFAFSGFALADGIDTLTVTGIDYSQGGGFQLYYPNNNGDPLLGYPMSDAEIYYAGVVDITLTQNGVSSPRETLCADLFTGISLNSYSDLVTLPSSIVPTSTSGNDLEEVSWLIDNAMLPDLGQGPFTSALSPCYWVSPLAPPAYCTTGTSAQIAEALQLAVWKLTVDGGGSFTKGLVQQAPGTDPVVLADAIQYLNFGQGQWTDNAYIYVNWSGTTPAQMLEGPMYFDNGPKPVAPEPATFVLVGAALIAIGWSWRRQIRKPRPCRG
jgi:hypothetical protein